ncbi:MAG: alpha/beta hydrolase [Micrococcales bacterium]|nr:alpha/beta hydrolase [Micrococcales bacterium]
MTTITLATHPRGTFPGEPPLVLLHAFPVDHEMWEPVAALLADLPVLLVDAPGFGSSPIIEPTVEAAAAALWRTLDALEVSRAVIGGLSMGGYLAMAALRAAPERVAGLALLDTKPTVDDDGARLRRLEIARVVGETASLDPVMPMADGLLGATTRRERPELLREVRGWIARCSPSSIVWAQAAMAVRPCSVELLRQARGLPAAIVVGEEDALSPIPVAEEMATLLVGASFTVVPAAGHLSAVENPTAVAAALRDLHERTN